MEVFTEGTLVQTPKGPGKVRYVRLAAPDYVEPIAYSIMLATDESGAAWRGYDLPNYVGTMFPADQVTRA